MYFDKPLSHTHSTAQSSSYWRASIASQSHAQSVPAHLYTSPCSNGARRAIYLSLFAYVGVLKNLRFSAALTPSAAASHFKPAPAHTPC